MDGLALWLTLKLAALTTLILIAVAVPLAWWIAQGGGAPRALVQSLVALPLVLPPTVLGFYLLTGFSPMTAAGRAVTTLLGHPLAFSFEGLLVASMIYSLPFAVQPMVAGFRSVPAGLIEASSGLGITPLETFARIALPMSSSAILTSSVLTFTHTVGEFGVVLMMGGNIPGVTQTLSIALFNQVEDGRYAAANATSLILLAFATLTLAAIYLGPSASRAAEPYD